MMRDRGVHDNKHDACMYIVKEILSCKDIVY
jgi:hypothetical protein